jgi:hypothetical protein
VAASPYKFFPGADGGWLYAPDAGALAGVAVRQPGWRDELRGLKQCFDEARRVPVNRVDRDALPAQVAALAAQTPLTGVDRRLSRAGPSAQYRTQHADRAALRSSRWLARHAAADALIRRRQAHYRRWLRAVAGLPHCQALYPELPDAVVPYMFALRIEHPLPHFYWLKQLGVPVWRWDEMAVSDCPVANDYRLRLLHLPCHQALRDEDMDWLLAALAEVLRRPPAGAGR